MNTRIRLFFTAPIFALLLMLFSGCTATPPTPAEGLSIPEIYQELLLDYENLVSYRLSEEFTEYYKNENMIPLSDSLKEALSETKEWSNLLVEMTYGGKYLTRESYGYILQDINGDNFPELFWVRADHHVLAIFTVFEEKLYLLDAFWPKHDCYVGDSWELCVIDPGGAYYDDYKIKRLEANSPALVTVKEFGKDNGNYYEASETGERISVTEARMEELRTQYPVYKMGARWENIPIQFLSPS